MRFLKFQFGNRPNLLEPILLLLDDLSGHWTDEVVEYVCKWIFSTWSAVATSTIAAGFRKCGLVERGCGENDKTEAETALVQEDADDIVHEMLEAGALDMEVGEFSLDDDFDDMFRSVADINLQQ
ncbi:unnamed protein product [Phytophthora lilii]|uniref:Unnamed protein product n=1 Tax=Phytophthora lilii TaxID=2077276 RepID=A0A9W6TNW3_9STRA|nr:unnamed protein product [Phytophthora lilii]